MHELNSRNSGNDKTLHMNEDMCIDLLSGLLKEEQSKTLLNHIRRCPSCEQIFQTAAAGFETARSRGEPSKDSRGQWAFQQINDISDEKISIRRKSSSWRDFFKILSPARAALLLGASAAVIAALIFLNIHRDYNQEALEYWIPDDRAILTPRSGSGNTDQMFWNGISAYNARDLDSAVKFLRISNARNSYDNLRDIYLASALSLRGKYKEALRIITSINLTHMPEPWRSETGWIRYIALSKTNRNEEAQKILDQLAELENDIGVQARERKKQLEKKSDNFRESISDPPE